MLKASDWESKALLAAQHGRADLAEQATAHAARHREAGVALHAEVDAIVKCRDLSSAHRILVTRVARNGSYALARPCKICMSAIEATPISKVEHT